MSPPDDFDELSHRLNLSSTGEVHNYRFAAGSIKNVPPIELFMGEGHRFGA